MRSFVKYCLHHSKKKLSLHHRAISSMHRTMVGAINYINFMDVMHACSAKLFASLTFLFSPLSGALNHQTTHHLFPGVSQYYYPQITPIIRKTCQEFGVRYNYKETFSQALGAHFLHLKSLGQAAEQDWGRATRARLPHNTLLTWIWRLCSFMLRHFELIWRRLPFFRSRQSVRNGFRVGVSLFYQLQ